MSCQLLPTLVKFLEPKGEKLTVVFEKKQPKLVDSKGNEIASLLEALTALSECSKKKDLFGKSPEEEAKIYQWVEYSARLNSQDLGYEAIHSTLKEINSMLLDRSYLTGFRFTVADVILFYTLHDAISKLTFHEKETYLHVSRWFNLMQHTPVKMKLLEVQFSRTRLY